MCVRALSLSLFLSHFPVLSLSHTLFVSLLSLPLPPSRLLSRALCLSLFLLPSPPRSLSSKHTHLHIHTHTHTTTHIHTQADRDTCTPEDTRALFRSHTNTLSSSLSHTQTHTGGQRSMYTWRQGMYTLPHVLWSFLFLPCLCFFCLAFWVFLCTKKEKPIYTYIAFQKYI